MALDLKILLEHSPSLEHGSCTEYSNTDYQIRHVSFSWESA